ncbi:MAG: hypothetical protein AB8H80_13310 [Planctomycetota bacterium]
MLARPLVSALIYLLAAVLLATATLSGQEAGAERATWRNFNQTFQLDLPDGWRQISPNEARQIGEDPNSPPELRLAQPTLMYAVGPIERWLEGDYSGPMLFVREQRDQWYIDEDYKQTLRDAWRAHGEINNVEHELDDIGKEKLGTQEVECIVATRTRTSGDNSAPLRCLDVYAPTARQQIGLTFACEPERFERHLPAFRSWLDSLTFARLAQEQASLGDRLWGPIVIGGLVGIVLIVLYKRTSARR